MPATSFAMLTSTELETATGGVNWNTAVEKGESGASMVGTIGGIAGAIAGGLSAGPIGAVVGGATVGALGASVGFVVGNAKGIYDTWGKK